MRFGLKIVPSSARASAALAAGLALFGAAACAPQDPGEAIESVTRAAAAGANKVDILFMIDDSSSMTVMQQKLLAQFPAFIGSLQALPQGLPDLHLAVVSSDMGAPSDQGAGIRCSQTGGDNGGFFVAPQGTCTATTLAAGATFIADDATGATKNFTMPDPSGLATVFQCIALLGANGCGFEHQLASVARALGADGQPAPASNAGFLRDDAVLAIVLLTNEDDCSAPASSVPLPIYSLEGATNGITAADGPIANYRCNGGPLGGHLCDDPTGPTPATLEQPPLNPPADATTGTPPTLTLTNCQSNDTSSSGLVPVGTLVAGIKALKAQPDTRIVVSAITAPATPYVVEWLPGQPSNTELWPQVEHSCGPTTDSSFGDPSVRVTQFVEAFGDNGVVASICDPSYQAAFQLIVNKIGTLASGSADAGGTGAGGGAGTGGAGGHVGASPDGGGPDAGETLGKGGGCGCRTGGAPAGGVWGLLLVVLCFVRRARRRV